MQALSIDQKTFQLKEGEIILGELKYKSLFSFAASIHLNNNNVYKLESVGFFGTSIQVKDGALKVAELKMNWKGHVVIESMNGEQFILKSVGFLKTIFIVENSDHEKLFQLDADFSWKKNSYSYAIEFNSAVKNKSIDSLFILQCIYACNYYISNLSGAGVFS